MKLKKSLLLRRSNVINVPAANNNKIKLCEKFQSIMIDNFESLSEGQVLIIIKMIEQLRKSEPNDTGAKKMFVNQVRVVLLVLVLLVQ